MAHSRERLLKGVRDWFRPPGRSVPPSADRRFASLSPAAERFPDCAESPLQESSSPAWPTRPESNDFLAHETASARLWNRSAFDMGADESSDVSRAGSQVGDASLGLSGSEAIHEGELLEFLASDLDPIPVDPVFREQLREDLWEQVLVDGIARRKGR
jgi:hypothetical protein